MHCGRLANAPDFRTCCRCCPASHTTQCGDRQRRGCAFRCGRRADKPRHTACCRRCPGGHTRECGERQRVADEADAARAAAITPVNGATANAALTGRAWVAAEHSRFLRRGTVIGQPLPPGTLTMDDRGIIQWRGRAVFICSIPWDEVSRFQHERPRTALALSMSRLHCSQCTQAGAEHVCTRCHGHLCRGCAQFCGRCICWYCEVCLTAHGCS